MKMNEIYNIKNRLSLKECGLRLKECREAKHLTQVELADLIGVVPQQISNYETGKRGFAPTAVALGSALGVSANYLLGYTDFKTLSDEWKANDQQIFNSDDLLIQYLRLQGYNISFETETPEHSQTPYTPKNMFTLGGNEKVSIDGNRINLIDFQYMLDDIKDSIDFILSKAPQYRERRINCIAIDAAHQAELREKHAHTKLQDLLASGKFVETSEGIFFQGDDIL